MLNRDYAGQSDIALKNVSQSGYSLGPIRIIKFPLLHHYARQPIERNPETKFRVLHFISPLRVRSFGRPGGSCCH